MKYRIIKRPSNQMYYIQTWDEKTYNGNYLKGAHDNCPSWEDYNDDMGEPSENYIGYWYYRSGFFSLRKAKRALKRIRRQTERDSRPDEVVWEDDD